MKISNSINSLTKQQIVPTESFSCRLYNFDYKSIHLNAFVSAFRKLCHTCPIVEENTSESIKETNSKFDDP